MHTAAMIRSIDKRLLRCSVAVMLVALALAAAAAGARGTTAMQCPLAASELSSVVGRTLQRVNLSDPRGDPSAQCALAVVAKGKAVTPQVYLTTAAGGVADLREMSAYYVQTRSRLATKPRVQQRPDIGPGAFTLAATTVPVTTLYFVSGKGTLGTLVVDLSDAPQARRDQQTVEKVFAAVLDRLS